MRWKGVLISAAAGAVLYLTLLAGADFEATLTAAGRLTWPWWLAVLGLSLVNYGLRFLRWDGYLRHFGHGLPVGRHLGVYLAGFALTTTPAKAGEAIRAVYLRPFGVSLRRCIATIYAERVVDLVAMAILAVLLFQMAAPAYRWLAAIAGTAAAALLLLQRPAMLRLAGGLTAWLPWRWLQQAVGHGIDCLAQASVLLRGPLLVHGVVLGLLSWGAETLAFYLVLEQLDVPLSLGAATGIYATAMLAGALSFIPGGLGGTELVMVSLLVLGGAPAPTAVAATTIIRVATLWFAVALGLLALFVTQAAERREAAASGSR